MPPSDNVVQPGTQPTPPTETANQQLLVHLDSPIEHAINEQDDSPSAQQPMEQTNQQQIEFTPVEPINK